MHLVPSVQITSDEPVLASVGFPADPNSGPRFDSSCACFDGVRSEAGYLG